MSARHGAVICVLIASACAPVVVGDGDAASDAATDSTSDAPADAATTTVVLVQKGGFGFGTSTAPRTLHGGLSSAVASGDFLVAVLASADPDASAKPSISDSLGNAWKSTGKVQCTLSVASLEIWYVASAIGGVLNITIAENGSSDAGAYSSGMSTYEFAGVAPSNALDIAEGECSGPTPAITMTSPSVSTSAKDVLFGVFADPCAQQNAPNVWMDAGVGWSTIDLAPYAFLFEDKSGSAGSYVATATNASASSCWVATIAAFKSQ